MSAISELRDERQQIEEAILSLERLARPPAAADTRPCGSKNRPRADAALPRARR